MYAYAEPVEGTGQFVVRTNVDNWDGAYLDEFGFEGFPVHMNYERARQVADAFNVNQKVG